MSEDTILRLLSDLCIENEKDVYTGHFVQSDIRFICKSLAELFCHNSTNDFRRIEYIQFMRKLCGRQWNHMSVNSSNFGTFLKASGLTKITDEDEDVIKFFKQCQIDLPKNRPISEITDFYKLKLKLYNENQQFLDFVHDRNMKNCKDFDYTPSKHLENFSENIQLLSSARLKDCSNEGKSFDAQSKAIESRREERLAAVKLSRAVINLQVENLDVILKNLVTDMEVHEDLFGFEIDFLQYLLLLEKGYSLDLVDRFPIIIEQPVIQAATDCLQNTSSIETLESVQFVLKISRQSEAARLTVKNLCYELFALSNYNLNMYRLVEIIK